MLLTANPSDGLITWIACPPSLRACCVDVPLALWQWPHDQRCPAMGPLVLAETWCGWLEVWLAPHSPLPCFCHTAPLRRLLPLTGNEEVLQDVHWVGLQLGVPVHTTTLAAYLAPPAT